MYLNYYVYMYLFFVSLMMFSYIFNHIMLNLMSMELLILNLMMLFMSYLLVINLMNLFMYYLIFIVCESVLGLSLLILLIRSNGNDNFNHLNLILW